MSSSLCVHQKRQFQVLLLSLLLFILKEIKIDFRVPFSSLATTNVNIARTTSDFRY